MRRLIAILMFLVFVDEGELSETVYTKKLFAPFSWVQGLLLDPLPIKLRPLDVILLVLLFIGAIKAPTVRPMRNALLLAMGTTVVWFVLGTMRGGDSRAASWQIYLMLAAPLAAFSVAANFQKVAHFRILGKAIVAAALYKAAMCMIFYLGYVRGTADVPPWMTTHADTVLWVTALSILVVNFLEERTRWAKVGALLFAPFILVAVQFNNRRLAYVSLAVSLFALYFLLPASAAKRKLKRIAVLMMPVMAAYVVVGWGRPEKIFKPLQSLHSVSSKPDASTLARNVENLSLIATASYSPATGSGWGHKYVELSQKYSIATAMELWQYVPHNSVLGLFAFTGFLGMLGYWMMFPTAVFLHSRTARLSKDPRFRSLGLVGVMTTITCMNQMFGDMGIFSWVNMYMLGLSWGLALRIPVEAGVWPSGRAPAVNPLPRGPTAPAENPSNTDRPQEAAAAPRV